MIISFIGGVVLGLVTVGAYTYRTMQVMGGRPLRTLGSSVMVSCTYWFSINFIVEDNLSGYVGFSEGAALATTWLSYLQRCESESEGG